MKLETLKWNLVREKRRDDRAVKLFYYEDDDTFVVQTSKAGRMHEESYRSGERADDAFNRAAAELGMP